MKLNSINELNRSYVEIEDEGGEISDDYRNKMLELNNITSLLSKREKEIDGCKKIYFEVSEMESLIDRFNKKEICRDEFIELFKAMAEVTEAVENLLIEEGNIIFRPECIFFDIKSSEYRFICLPVNKCNKSKNDNIRYLLQFFLQRLDENDIDFLKSIYSLFDKLQTNSPGSRAIYEILCSELVDKKENIDDEKPIKEPSKVVLCNNTSENKKYHFYIPSFKEILAVLCTGIGIILIGYRTYLMML